MNMSSGLREHTGPGINVKSRAKIRGATVVPGAFLSVSSGHTAANAKGR